MQNDLHILMRVIDLKSASFITSSRFVIETEIKMLLIYLSAEHIPVFDLFVFAIRQKTSHKLIKPNTVCRSYTREVAQINQS